MSLHHRKDNRTISQFKEAIAAHTKKERIAAEALRLDMELRFGLSVAYTDFGVDNSGELIEGKVHANPDYLFKVGANDATAIEIKVHSERWDFLTFKTSNLLNYRKHNGSIAVARETYYYMFNPQAIDYILGTIEAKIYHGFSPNDPAHRVHQDTLDELVGFGFLGQFEWEAAAKEYLDKGKIFR